jgi:hypothetical protein
MQHWERYCAGAIFDWRATPVSTTGKNKRRAAKTFDVPSGKRQILNVCI